MRASVTSLSKKFISTFFAATLALGLVPAAAFADINDDAANSEDVTNVVPNEEVQDKSVGDALASSDREQPIEDAVATGEDSNLVIPAANERINETMTLQTRTVAQAESTRSYFLAQTLESTRTVPIVSANLPLDTGSADVAEPEGDGQSAIEEGGEDSDESDLGSASIALSSVVVGSFEYRGITYAVEPGGETVAVVAADYKKLPEEFIENQVIVLPSMVSSDGIDYYSVSRIADYAFSTITSEVASQHVISSGAAEGAEDEESALLIEDRAADTDQIDGAEDEESSTNEESVGIIAIGIPASITSIGDDAFSGFDALQYVIVSEDNPVYSMYDGCLYDADQTSLLLIPEGRLGAVRIAPSVTSVDPEVFSHCPSVDTLVADPDSAAYQLLSESDLHNVNNESISVLSAEDDTTFRAKNDLSFYTAFLQADDEADIRAMSETAREVASVAAPEKGDYEESGDVQFRGMVVSGYTTTSSPKRLQIIGRGLRVMYRACYDPGTDGAGKYDQWPANHVCPTGSNGVSGCNGTTTSPTGYSDYIIWRSLITPETEAKQTYPNSCKKYRFYSDGCLGVSTGHRWYVKARGANNRMAKALVYYKNDTRYTINIPSTGYVDVSVAELGSGTYKSTTNRPDDIALFLDYQDVVTWDASSYGSKFSTVKDSPENEEYFNNSGASMTKYVFLDDGVDSNGKENIVSIPAYDLANVPGFTFKGWATQAGTDALGNRTFNTTYKRWVDGEEKTFSCTNGGYLGYNGNPGDNLVIEADTTFYAVFAADLTWDASTYGGSFADDDSTANRTQEVIYGNKVAVPAVKPEDGSGWTFAGWTTRQKDTNGNLIADASMLDGVKLNPYITTSRTGYVTATKDNYGYANTTENVHYYAVWNIAPTWSKMDGALSTMTVNTAGVPTSVVYGTKVTAPAVGSPDSHHFDKWRGADGTTSEDVTDGDGNIVSRTIVVKSPNITGCWAPNERDVVLNSNGGTNNGQIVWCEYGTTMSTTLSGGGNLRMPTRKGYVFAGYWNTRYAETTGAEEVVPTTKLKSGSTTEYETIKVKAQCYYGVNDADNPTAFADMSTWNITNDDQQLFAHWRYKVVLNLNTFNSDGEAVLNGEPDATDVGFDAELAAIGNRRTEQGVIATDGTFNYTAQGLPVEGSSKTLDRVVRYTFTAIAGAPVQLPTVTGRTGYNDTSAWTLQPGTADKAIVFADAANLVTAPYPFGEAPVINSYNEGITVYADWAPIGPDGKPASLAKTYWVKLQAAYDVTIGDESDSFAVTSASAEPQYVKVAYDAELPISGLTVPVDATTELSAATGAQEPRNLRLDGFYTQKNLLTTNLGEKYLAVTGPRDNRTLTNSINGTAHTYKFRETNAGGQPGVTLEDVPASVLKGEAAQKAVVLYGRWLTASSTISFNLNGGTISYGGTTYGSVADGWLAPTKLTGVVTAAPVPDPTNELTVRPYRTGYEFAGYWTHPYLEDGTVSVKYYDVNGSAVRAVQENGANRRWNLADDTVLYAHWTYTIVFDQGSDKSGNKLACELKHLGDSAILGGTDIYGNTYIYDGATGTGNIRSIKAVAGAPVKLPFACGRPGYDDTAQWCATVGGELVPIDVDDDGWTGLGAASITPPGPAFTVPGGALANAVPDGTSRQITLSMDWDNETDHEAGDGFEPWSDHAKRYWIALRAGYEHAGETFAVQPAATVQYVQVSYEDYIDVDDLLVPVDATTVLLPGSDATKTQRQNLLLEGFYNTPYAATDMPDSARLYVKATNETADGDASINGADTATTKLSSGATAGTRFFTLADQTALNAAEVNSANTNADGSFRAEVDGHGTKAYDLWAKWSRPSTVVTFDMNDGGMADKGATLTSTNVGKPNDVTVKYLTQPGALSVKVPERAGYRFNGYWAEPYSEADAASRYYDANGNAAPTWNYTDASKTLYAHWVYDIVFDCNGAADGHEDDALSMTTTVSPLRVLYGAAAAFDHTSDTVKRVRDGEATGYTFGGWIYNTTETDGEGVTKPVQKVLATADAPGAASYADIFAKAPWILTPNPASFTATLYANWTPETYTISFDDVPADMTYYKDGFRMDLASATSPSALHDVEFDAKLPTTIEPPRLLGYLFQGFYTEPNGGGTQFYYSNGSPTEALMTSGVNTLYAHYEQIDYNVKFVLTDSSDAGTQATTGSVSVAPATAAAWHYGDSLTAKTLPGVNAAGTGLTFARQGYEFNGWYYYPSGVEHTEANRRYIATYDKNGKAFMPGLSGFAVNYTTRDCTAAELGGATDGNTYKKVERTERWNPILVGGAQVKTWNTYAYDTDLHEVTFYAGWTPRTYTVTFHTNYQDGQAQNSKKFTYYYEQMIEPDMIMQLGDTGAPKTFAGWNASPTATPDAAANWLEDASTEPRVKMGLTEDGRQAGGKFMPNMSNDALPQLTYYAVWNNESAMGVYLFPGMRGTFTGTAAAPLVRDGFVVDSYLFSAPYELSTAEPNPTVDGWEFAYWQKLDPSEYTFTSEETEAFKAAHGGTEPTKMDMLVAKRDSINSRVRTVHDDFAFGSQIYPRAYRDDANPAQRYEDYFLVAVWKLQSDYRITLDFGNLSLVDDGFVLQPDATAPGNFQAKTVASGNTVYEYSFNVERQAATGAAFEPTPDFAMPNATRYGHTLQGFRLKNGGDYDMLHGEFAELSPNELIELQHADETGFVNLAVDGKLPREVEYEAVWSQNRYRIMSDEGDVWAEVAYDDTFYLPWPAHRSGGFAHSCYSLSTHPTNYAAYGGRFAPDTEYRMSDVIRDIEATYSTYQAANPDSWPMVTPAEDEDGVFDLTFRCHWNTTLSVTVPTECTILVDTNNKTVHPTSTTLYTNTSTPLEIVSLRYSMMKAAGTEADDGAESEYVFGVEPGETDKSVYLSVYPDAKLGEKSLTYDDEAYDAATGVYADEAGTKTPMLIDMKKNVIVPKTLTFSEKMGRVQTDAVSGTLQLDDYAFRPFSQGTDTFTVSYGLVFKGVENLRDEFATLAAIPTDSGQTRTIAHLYYTVKQA